MTGTAWATNWVPTLHSSSAGEAKAQERPRGPHGVHGRMHEFECEDRQGQLERRDPGHDLHRVRHHDVRHGDLQLHRDRVTTTSWTSGTLSAANYWFEVAAYTGTNWIGTKSTATAESTISSSGCVQP